MDTNKHTLDKKSCSSTYEQKKWILREVRKKQMDQKGWQISEAVLLLGLSRRDIQRACYGDKARGGVGILEPQDSQWGRRSFDRHDLATLEMVACLRKRGMSLPEIKRLFDSWRLREDGLMGFAESLLDQEERTERDAEETCLRLLLLRPFLDCGANDADGVNSAVVNETVNREIHHVLERALSILPAKIWCESAGACVCSFVEEPHLLCEGFLDAGDHPLAERLADLVAGVRLSASEGMSSRRAKQLFWDIFLGSPAVDLALELRFGPGSFETTQGLCAGI